MLVSIIRRLAAAVLVMVVVAAITFTMLHGLRPESFPPDDRLLDYLRDVFLHQEFGITREPPPIPVATLLSQGIGPSVSLLAGSIVTGLLLGLTGGMVAAARRGTMLARAIEAVAMFALCAPVYWVGLMLLVLFAPVGGAIDAPFDIRDGNYAPLMDDPKQWLDALIIPWLVLGAPLAGLTLRMMRSSTIGVLGEDFIRTARAKGLTGGRVLRRHVLPAGAAPSISLTGAFMPLMVTNLVLVERVFNVPGVFRYTTEAMDEGEFEVLQALVIVGAFLVVVGNLLVDLVLSWLDPRTR